MKIIQILFIAITEKSNFTVHFEFEEVNLKHIEKQILTSILRKLLRQIASQLKYLKKRLTSAALCFSRYGMMKF